MKSYRGYLIDLDGTMYRGNEKIESAVRFVNRLHEKNIPHLFVTNNSSKTPEEVAEKLQQYGVQAAPEQILTSSLATAGYIRKQKQDANVYMIGENGLKQALKDEGLTIVADVNGQTVDYVVIGIDRYITYEKFVQACLAIQNGARFISTNADKAIPTERGFVPGNGALTSVIATATGIDPIFIGKPERIIIELALERLNASTDEVIMVGDNYDTDIRSGINAGIDTLLVFTGVTSKADLKRVSIQPTYTVDSLDDWSV